MASPVQKRGLCPTWSSEIRDLAAAAVAGRKFVHGNLRDPYSGACCPLVLDTYTLLALLTFTAAATYFLRNTVTKETFNGRSFPGSWEGGLGGERSLLSPLGFTCFLYRLLQTRIGQKYRTAERKLGET